MARAALSAGNPVAALACSAERARLCVETVAHGTLDNAPAGRRLVALGAALQRGADAHGRVAALASQIVELPARDKALRRRLRCELRAVVDLAALADRDIAELAARVRDGAQNLARRR